MVANLPAVPDLHNNNNNGLSSSNTNSSLPNYSSIVNLDRGDTVLLESYWRKMNEECTVVIKGWEFLSYASDMRSVCWFLMPELRDAIQRLHALVGNALTDGCHIVVGNGSTQLLHASLFALSSSSGDGPLNVVAAAPYYSGYPIETDLVRSSLYKWSGDAKEYEKNEAYIEIVTSPNNPDGSIRRPMVSNNKCGCEGKLIHDLAYYWPHFTPITYKANHDLMLFTLSKCTGHSGSRIGWAIVKDIDVAKKMTTFIMLNSIGVSKESQARAAKLMGVICDGYQNIRFDGSKSKESELFFEYSRGLLKERWEKLREVVKQSDGFMLPKFQRAYCNFTNEVFETYPAFAWLMCKDDEDCGSYLEKELRVVARNGNRFGSHPKYVRINMLTTGDDFDEFLERLSNIKDISY